MERQRIQLLLVEDSPDDALLIREYFADARQAEFKVDHVERLQSGLERLALGDIDAVLLDLQLPDSRGLDTFRAVQKAAPGLPVIVLFGPLVFPVARALGMSDVHYAMIIIIAMGIGLFAPPFGLGFYAACAIGRVNPTDAMRHIWPYLAVLLVGLVIIAVFPQITTALL